MTMTLLPLRDYPRGLTVIPAQHQATFAAARDAAHSWADRYGLDIEDGPLAAMFLALQAELEQLLTQAAFARAEACAVRDQLEAAAAELNRLRDAEAAAVVRRRLQAERRDKALREEVRQRDGDNCRYCGTDVIAGARGTAALDHVVPDMAIGAGNVVVACRPCRRAKTARTPEQAGMSLRPAPITVRLSPPASPRKEAMSQFVDDHQLSEPVEGQLELTTYQVDEIRLTVTYPPGVSPHTISVAWVGGVTEPTPDELVEMINQLRPNVEPASVSVTGVVDLPVPPWMRRDDVRDEAGVAAPDPVASPAGPVWDKRLRGSQAQSDDKPAPRPPEPALPESAPAADAWPYTGDAGRG